MGREAKARAGARVRVKGGGDEHFMIDPFVT